MGNGTNVLNWNRNSIKPSVQFMVQAKIGASISWALADVTSATKFNRTGQTPGVKAVYRVRARRGRRVSVEVTGAHRDGI